MPPRCRSVDDQDAPSGGSVPIVCYHRRRHVYIVALTQWKERGEGENNTNTRKRLEKNRKPFAAGLFLSKWWPCCHYHDDDEGEEEEDDDTRSSLSLSGRVPRTLAGPFLSRHLLHRTLRAMATLSIALARHHRQRRGPRHRRR